MDRVLLYWRFRSLKSACKGLVWDFIKIRKQKKHLEAAASLHYQNAKREADKILAEQRQKISAANLDFPISHSTMACIEMQFMSGVYLYHDEQIDLPTPADERAFLNLIPWLCSEFDWDLEKARREVAELKHLHSENDSLFLCLHNAGKEAAEKGGGYDLLLKAVLGLRTADLEFGSNLLTADLNRRSN